MCIYYTSTFHSSKLYLLLKVCNVNFALEKQKNRENEGCLHRNVIVKQAREELKNSPNSSELSLDLFLGPFCFSSIQSLLDLDEADLQSIRSVRSLRVTSESPCEAAVLSSFLLKITLRQNMTQRCQIWC